MDDPITKPCCYDCLSEDVAVKVIDLCGSEHWFCAVDWAANQALHDKIMSMLGDVLAAEHAVSSSCIALGQDTPAAQR